MEDPKKDKKSSSKLKKLVYASLAGALVGVTCTAGAGHGNASAHRTTSFDWDAVEVSNTAADTNAQPTGSAK